MLQGAAANEATAEFEEVPKKMNRGKQRKRKKQNKQVWMLQGRLGKKRGPHARRSAGAAALGAGLCFFSRLWFSRGARVHGAPIWVREDL